MSQIDKENLESSEEQGRQNEKMVSVNEAIRYRKRAQNAEQKYQKLEEQLAQSREQIDRLGADLNEAHCREELVKALASAGAMDMEAAVLIAKTRLENDSGSKAADIVVQMQKEKAYLFDKSPDRSFAAATMTRGAREKMPNASASLERAAKRAAASGSRTDLQDYLRMRRKLV